MPASTEPDSPAPDSVSLVAGVWELPEDTTPAAATSATVGAALAEVARRGGGPVSWWVEDATPERDELAAAAGLHPTRRLLQLRRRLPAAAPPPAVGVRPFVPGRDEDAWLAVNNRAFAWHPDQGGWSRARLEQTLAEPWFDPAGFLVHEEAGRLAAFCWTKVHTEPEHLGEIFVIAVDPELAGRGLGRALTLAGLDHLWTVRHTPTGMLYVEADNDRALELYRGLGFETHHERRRYEGHVQPAAGRRST